MQCGNRCLVLRRTVVHAAPGPDATMMRGVRRALLRAHERHVDTGPASRKISGRAPGARIGAVTPWPKNDVDLAAAPAVRG